MSSKKLPLFKIISFLVSLILGLMSYYFFISSLANRLGFYSSFTQLFLIILAVLIIYVLIQLIRFKKLNKFESRLLLVAYGLSIVCGLFLRGNSGVRQGFFHPDPWGGMAYSLNPLSFIDDFRLDPSSAIANILNVLLFIPLKPILTMNKISSRWWWIILGFFLLEFAQLALGLGAFDLGDIVLYTAGYFIGVGLMCLWARRKQCS